ncbi:MAG: 4-coumarate--CoA ligase family protein [Armatimonadetes bacterium]|nr:4-coumarate--CoA ligase family protein [Armatimonadota bacterium]
MIFKSPYPQIEIPNQSLTDYVFAHSGSYLDRPALIDGPTGRELSYGKLIGMIRMAAAGLAAKGFTKGDAIAIYSPNIPEYVVAIHAAARLGGIVSTANPLYTADELAFQLRDSRAKMLFTIPQLMDKASDAAKQVGGAEIVVFGEAEGATPFATLFQHGDQPPNASIDPTGDTVCLPYSSGTTGMPKGVMLTHRNLVANLAQTEATIGAFEFQKMLGLLPIFHIYGLVAVTHLGLRMGKTLVTMPRFELEGFLQILQDYKIELANLVPPIILGLAKHPAVAQYDLSSLRLVLSGAAPLGADVVGEASSRIGCAVSQGYGLTETSPVTHVLPFDYPKPKPGSIGPLVPNTEAKIIDVSTGEELGTDQDGELLIRGPQVMKGYLNNPEATAQCIDSDGFLHTGDMARVDSDGCFYIVDRLKELIKYKGYQVPPAELEALLLTHPAVADAAVIPALDEEAGEVPKAFVVKRAEVSAEELMEFVAGKVAPYKKIRYVEFIDAVPKSPAGKILRRTLIEKDRA